MHWQVDNDELITSIALALRRQKKKTTTIIMMVVMITAFSGVSHTHAHVHLHTHALKNNERCPRKVPCSTCRPRDSLLGIESDGEGPGGGEAVLQARGKADLGPRRLNVSAALGGVTCKSVSSSGRRSPAADCPSTSPLRRRVLVSLPTARSGAQQSETPIRQGFEQSAFKHQEYIFIYLFLLGFIFSMGFFLNAFKLILGIIQFSESGEA